MPYATEDSKQSSVRLARISTYYFSSTSLHNFDKRVAEGFFLNFTFNNQKCRSLTLSLVSIVNST